MATFSVGDLIVYGSMGVCTVEKIGVPEISGATRECYILRPMYVANSRVYAPIEDNPVNMRLVLTPTQAHTLIDSLPKINEFPFGKEKQELYDTCRQTIKSADSHALARLVKTLRLKKEQTLKLKKVVPSVEKEYSDTAEKIFYGEIAAALEMPIENVEDYIYTRLGA